MSEIETELFLMTSAKSGGGKTNELLCNEPLCNALNGAITLYSRSVV